MIGFNPWNPLEGYAIPGVNVAFLFSLVVSTLMTLVAIPYGKRRPKGTPFSWGEAMLGAAYVFFVWFIAFGIVPHQWLTLAENEWGWTADRLLFGPGDIVKPIAEGGWFPFTLTYRTVSDSIAAIFYIVFLGGMSALWAMWQTRGKVKKGADVVKSTYGRPLVKQG